MDSFATIPVEICQSILEALTNLRDLQSAILCSRSLHYAYQASRRLIRQRVFYNQTLLCVLEAGGDLEACAFIRASRLVEDLERKNPHDGLILRESLWPHLMAAHQNKPTDILCAWSRDLAEAYRVFHYEEKARHVEAQAMHLLICLGKKMNQFTEVEPNPHHVYVELFLKWLHPTMAACARYKIHDYGAKLLLFSDAWKHWVTISNHQTVLGLIKAIELLCSDDGHGRGATEVAKPALHAVIARGWSYLRHVNASQHQDVDGNVLCFNCFDAAKLLLAATRSAGIGPDVTLSSIEAVWRGTPPRSPAFTSWARLVLESHRIWTSRLQGALKVWARLREAPPADQDHQFETYDLDWAREVILELRKQNCGWSESLHFQASVLALMRRGSPQYYAFARNLADCYLRSGDFLAAIEVREQIWQELQPSSQLYSSWGRALANLYRRTGRDQNAENLNIIL